MKIQGDKQPQVCGFCQGIGMVCTTVARDGAFEKQQMPVGRSGGLKIPVLFDNL